MLDTLCKSSVKLAVGMLVIEVNLARYGNKKCLKASTSEKLTLLRLIPTMTFQDVHLDVYSIYADNKSDIYSQILPPKEQ